MTAITTMRLSRSVAGVSTVRTDHDTLHASETPGTASVATNVAHVVHALHNMYTLLFFGQHCIQGNPVTTNFHWQVTAWLSLTSDSLSL